MSVMFSVLQEEAGNEQNWVHRIKSSWLIYVGKGHYMWVI